MLRRPLHHQAFPSGIHPIQVPASWKAEACLERGIYFVIPLQLWNLIVSAVGSDRFSSSDHRRELEIAQAAGERTGNIAIRLGAFLSYADLSPVQPVQLTADEAAFLGKNPAQAAHLGQQATARLNLIHGPRRGYLGWLLTNPAFVQEHDRLLQQHGPSLEVHGFPQPRGSSARIPEHALGNEVDWVHDCRQFYARWRLQSLVLPDLPLPLPFQLPAMEDPATVSPQEGVATMSVPDIYAVRGRGLIEETLEDALRGRGAPCHLQGWFEIVQQSSTMANVLPMYDRWFRLQHYWRLLHRRYPAALRRKKRALIYAFACFLEVSIDTLKADLRRITGRLGAGWEQR